MDIGDFRKFPEQHFSLGSSLGQRSLLEVDLSQHPATFIILGESLDL